MPKRASFYIPCKPMALNFLSHFPSPFRISIRIRKLFPSFEFFSYVLCAFPLLLSESVCRSLHSRSFILLFYSILYYRFFLLISKIENEGVQEYINKCNSVLIFVSFRIAWRRIALHCIALHPIASSYRLPLFVHFSSTQ